MFAQDTLLPPCHSSILCLCSWLYSRYCTIKVLYTTCPIVHPLSVFLAVLQVMYSQGTILLTVNSLIFFLCSWLYSRYCNLKVFFSHCPLVHPVYVFLPYSRYSTPQLQIFCLCSWMYSRYCTLKILYYNLPTRPSAVCCWLYSRYCTFQVIYYHLPSHHSSVCIPSCNPGNALSRYGTPTCYSFTLFL